MRTQQPELIKHWREVIGRQQRSGQSVRGFCRENAIGEHSFYLWRQKLERRSKETPGASFALVETGNGAARAGSAPVELHFANGEKLLVPAGADAATLRTVVAVMRERA